MHFRTTLLVLALSIVTCVQQHKSLVNKEAVSFSQMTVQRWNYTADDAAEAIV